ncbi:PAS domain S-box-containing protein [Filimonas lacunae]|uniref:histidine kinase n=1 Tax=Filimonas lacunae TaxID=477680 RepID=A0A173MHE9_9BACT|nr:ATP-binding protein [Filimonas lacunae]BAV07042.1 multi-sensor signal transduction histidine kinase [Filimonas lacunae]SIS95835.1 PAS domain S-box-containing protein [Filimonas lacunae]
MDNPAKTKDLLAEVEELRRQLGEANDTIEAIRTGQVDAFVVENGNGHELYTLLTADRAYRMFIEKMNEGVVNLTTDGIILYANSRFAEMVQQQLSHVIGMSFYDYAEAAFRPQLLALMQARQEGDSKGELQLLAGKQGIPVQLSLTTLEQAEGHTVNIILTDLSSQKAAQKQLENANIQLAQTNETLETRNHDLQQFASVASHDLQEPLRKVMLYSNIIKESFAAGLGGKGIAYVDKIIKASERMKRLIIEILNYSKLSAGEGDYIVTDINTVITDILEDFELLIAEKNATVIAGHLPTLEVNPGQIRQVLQNLLSNALKFGRNNVPLTITITAERLQEKSFESRRQTDGPYCLLNIADNGIGFDQKYALQIFSLFERLNSKDQYEGTGIGLAISKKIIDSHKGLIRAVSNPDQGALFQVVLPVRHT